MTDRPKKASQTFKQAIQVFMIKNDYEKVEDLKMRLEEVEPEPDKPFDDEDE